ncbi:MAG: hypothetical protein ACE5KE_13315 [Methanosarcinales archaeon]
MTAPIYLVYYLLPNDLGIGFPKQYVILIVLSLVLLIEAIRIKTNRVFFGLREYERWQISAFAWAAIGIALSFLFFPKKFVVPTIIGMAFIDPMIGEIQIHKKEWYPFVPALCYALILLVCLILWSTYSVRYILLFTVVGTIVAIASEYPKYKYIDDDFLMLMAPLVVLTFLDFLLLYAP